MREETAEEKTRANQLANEWDEERKLRRAVLEVQAAEALALHGQFEARNERATALQEAQIVDCLSVVRHREAVLLAVEKQTAILDRIATALERSRP